MRGLPILALALALSGLGGAAAGQVRLESRWTLSGLDDPESVALSADGQVLYVANVAGEGDAKDGKGHISKVSRDGTLIERAWASGLDAPKGLVLSGGRLWASDIGALVEIDLSSGKVVGRHAIAGAVFLNDVAAAPGGGLLAADSGTGKVHLVKDGKAELWAEDPLLRSVNGLLPEPSRLVVTTMAGRLLAIDYASRRVDVLAEGLGQADGVAALGAGRYLVSEWPGRLFEVAPDGSAQVLIDSRKAGSYINDFILVGDELIVPNWKPGALVSYRLRR